MFFTSFAIESDAVSPGDSIPDPIKPAGSPTLLTGGALLCFLLGHDPDLIKLNRVMKINPYG